MFVLLVYFWRQDVEIKILFVQALQENVLKLEHAYHVSFGNEDMDKCVNFCRIFTEMAECFLQMIVDHPNHVSTIQANIAKDY